MTHKFKVGDEVLVRGVIGVLYLSKGGIENVTIPTHMGNIICHIKIKNIKPIETPFLIEGRTYQCREEGLTATVSKNERGWWVATWSDGGKITISEKGFEFGHKDSGYDLITLIPKPVICKCCGQVVKEKE